jgi:hypothetical protein
MSEAFKVDLSSFRTEMQARFKIAPHTAIHKPEVSSEPVCTAGLLYCWRTRWTDEKERWKWGACSMALAASPIVDSLSSLFPRPLAPSSLVLFQA